MVQNIVEVKNRSSILTSVQTVRYLSLICSFLLGDLDISHEPWAGSQSATNRNWHVGVLTVSQWLHPAALRFVNSHGTAKGLTRAPNKRTIINERTIINHVGPAPSSTDSQRERTIILHHQTHIKNENSYMQPIFFFSVNLKIREIFFLYITEKLGFTKKNMELI